MRGRGACASPIWAAQTYACITRSISSSGVGRAGRTTPGCNSGDGKHAGGQSLGRTGLIGTRCTKGKTSPRPHLRHRPRQDGDLAATMVVFVNASAQSLHVSQVVNQLIRATHIGRVVVNMEIFVCAPIPISASLVHVSIPAQRRPGPL